MSVVVDVWDSQNLPIPQNDLRLAVSVSDGTDKGGWYHMLPLVPGLLPPNILLLPALRRWEGCGEQEDCTCRGKDCASEGRGLQGFSLSKARNGL